jgi:diguanylate cyclase (GGDEF)-like protein
MSLPAHVTTRSAEFLEMLRHTASQQERAAELYRALIAVNDLAVSLHMAKTVTEVQQALSATLDLLMPGDSIRICSLTGEGLKRIRLSGPALATEEGLTPESQGLLASVLKSGSPSWIPDTLGVQMSIPGSGAPVSVLSRSVIMAPFYALGSIAGALEVVSSRPNRFDEMDFNLVLMIATHLSSALDNILTREELASANIQLRKQEERLTVLNRQLRELAHRDEVTGLFNKRRLTEQLEAEIARVRRYGEIFSCLMIDIDFFKQLNDTFGHQAGDEALRQFGALLLRNLRVTDFVARYGGEEFTVLLPCTDRAGAWHVAETLRTAVRSNVFVLPGGSYHLTISVGISTCTKFDRFDSQAVIVRSDKALYRAKRTGRDRSCFVEEAEAVLPDSQ